MSESDHCVLLLLGQNKDIPVYKIKQDGLYRHKHSLVAKDVA